MADGAQAAASTAPIAGSSKDLWSRAFDQLQADQPKLIVKFEAILRRDAQASVATSGVVGKDLQRNIADAIVTSFISRDPAGYLQKAGHATERAFSTLVKVTIGAKDFVSSAIALEPHAALAWVGSPEVVSKSSSTLWDVLCIISNGLSQPIVCVLDALDEAEEAASQRFLEDLNNFYSRDATSASPCAPVKFLITSRPYDWIRMKMDRFKKQDHCPLNSIRAADAVEALRVEINAFIDEEVPDIVAEKHLPSTATRELAKYLKGRGNRTYLWVDLILKHIRATLLPSCNIKDIIDSLQHLPQDVTDIYEAVLQKSRNTEVARTILELVVAATRPLTISELQLMLAVHRCRKAGSLLTKITLYYLGTAEYFSVYVQNMCGFFCTIRNWKVYLIHPSAREFLVSKEIRDRQQDSKPVWRSSVSLLDAHSTLSEVCIDYLTCFPDLVSGRSHDRDFARLFQPGDWEHETGPSLDPYYLSELRVLDLLDDQLEGRVPSQSPSSSGPNWFLGDDSTSLTRRRPRDHSRGGSPSREMDIGFTGNEDDTDSEYDSSLVDKYSKYDPASLARLIRISSLQERLNEQNIATATAQSRVGEESPKNRSRVESSNHGMSLENTGHIGGVERETDARMIDKLSQFPTIFRTDTTPNPSKLSEYASRKWMDHYRMTLVLQGFNARSDAALRLLNPQEPATFGWYDEYRHGMKYWHPRLPTQLILVSYFGLASHVSASTGIDLNTRDRHGMTALLWATVVGHLDVVERLLAVQGILVNKASPKGFSALLFAAEHGRRLILKLLLEYPGIDVTKRSTTKRKTWSPVTLAAHNRRYGCLAILLEHYKKIDPPHPEVCQDCADLAHDEFAGLPWVRDDEYTNLRSILEYFSAKAVPAAVPTALTTPSVSRGRSRSSSGE